MHRFEDLSWSLERGFFIEDLCSRGFHIIIRTYRCIWLRKFGFTVLGHKFTKMSIFKSYRGKAGPENPRKKKRREFLLVHILTSLRIYKWVFHDFKESGNLSPRIWLPNMTLVLYAILGAWGITWVATNNLNFRIPPFP